MRSRSVLWLVLLGILAIGLTVGPDLWAAPGQSPARQTVPTQTPPVPPTEPPTKSPSPSPKDPPPPDQPTLAPTAAVGTILARGPSERLLPEVGGRSIRLHLGTAMIVVGFLILVVARRHA